MCTVLSFLSELESGELLRRVYRGAAAGSEKRRGCCGVCTVLSFLVVSGRRCVDDVPRVGSLLPCVGDTSVQRVMSDDRWLPAEKSTARRASGAHSGAVPLAESAACCVPMCVVGACQASHVP